MQKVTSSWFFLSTLNYDARSTTHQINFCSRSYVPLNQSRAPTKAELQFLQLLTNYILMTHFQNNITIFTKNRLRRAWWRRYHNHVTYRWTENVTKIIKIYTNNWNTRLKNGTTAICGHRITQTGKEQQQEEWELLNTPPPTPRWIHMAYRRPHTWTRNELKTDNIWNYRLKERKQRPHRLGKGSCGG